MGKRFNRFKEIIHIDNRIVYCAIILISISLLCLFLPVIKVRTYSVYMYNLERTEIGSKTINIFGMILGNDYFNRKLIFLGVIFVPILIVLLLFIYTKKHNPIILISVLVLCVCLVIGFSYFNTIYTKVLNGKVYCYQDDFLKFSKEITPIVPIDRVHQISYWIDLGYGSFIIIALNSISFVLLFVSSFLHYKKEDENHHDQANN